MIDVNKMKDLDELYLTIQKKLEDEEYDDAGIYVRRINEYILKLYIEQYLPEYNNADAFDKINALKEQGIIDAVSSNNLHKFRKIGNKAAHGEKVEKNDIKECIAPIRLEIERINFSLANPDEDEMVIQNYTNELRDYEEDWVSIEFESASSAHELNLLIEILEQYDNDSARGYIRKCKDKKTILWEQSHQVEIKISEIRKKAKELSKYFAICDSFIAISTLDREKKYLTLKNCEQKFIDAVLKYIGEPKMSQIVFAHGDTPYMLWGDSRKVVKYDRVYNKWEFISSNEKELEDIVEIYECKFSQSVFSRTKKGYLYEHQHYSGITDYFFVYNQKPTKKLYYYSPILVIIYEDNSIDIRSNDSLYKSYIFRNHSRISNDIQNLIMQNSDIIQISFEGGLFILFGNGNLFYTSFIYDDYDMIKQLEQYPKLAKICIHDAKTHNAFLTADGTVITESSLKEFDPMYDERCLQTSEWTDIIDIFTTENNTFGVTSDGHLRIAGTFSKYDNSYIIPNLDHVEDYIKQKKEKQIAYLKNRVSEIQRECEPLLMQINSLSELCNKLENKKLFRNQKEINKAHDELNNLTNKYNSLQAELININKRLEKY